VQGREELCGARLEVPDLRAGAALVLAALAAHGISYVEQIQHIDRGYQGFEYTLSSLGANIKRESAATEMLPLSLQQAEPCLV